MMKRNREEKRSSTRTVVVSKAMKVVDEDTRREHREKRLATLEADNYVEDASADDAYGDDEDDEGGDGSPAAKKKKARASKSSSGAVNKWALRRPKPLEKMILEQAYIDFEDYGLGNEIPTSHAGRYPNIPSVEAPASSRPARKFCSVCGLQGIYSCTRCGLRYCSSRCLAHHKETRCLKFSM